MSESGGARLDEMNPDLAEQWELWSVQIGQAIYPAVEELRSGIPDISEIMVCTADGLNVVALGLEDSQVSRLSALATSMFAVGRAASQVTRGARGDSPQTLVMHDGEHHTVLLAMSGLVTGGMLLWVTARSTPLGSLLVRSRRTAEQITELLRAEPAGA